jgi:hypothetical protein
MARARHSAVRTMLDRPISFHRCLAQAGGGVHEGLMLSQALYWMERTDNPDGWFWKTQEDWQEETMLNRYQQEQARKNLRERGLLQERRAGLPAKLYFRVDEEALQQALLQPECYVRKNADPQQTSAATFREQDCRPSADRFADPQHSSNKEAETTSETTQRLHADAAEEGVQAVGLNFRKALFAYYGHPGHQGDEQELAECVRTWEEHGIAVAQAVLMECARAGQAWWRQQKGVMPRKLGAFLTQLNDRLREPQGAQGDAGGVQEGLPLEAGYTQRHLVYLHKLQPEDAPLFFRWVYEAKVTTPDEFANQVDVCVRYQWMDEFNRRKEELTAKFGPMLAKQAAGVQGGPALGMRH